MPNKLSAYIDLAKLQGAHRLTLKGKGGVPKDCPIDPASLEEDDIPF